MPIKVTRKLLHKDPVVATFDNCATVEECQAIIKSFDGSMERAVVSGDKKGIESKGRTNSVKWVPHNFSSTSKSLCSRISQIVGLPLNVAENMQVIKYEVDQEYRAHFDAFDEGTKRGLRNLKNGGQRLYTALFYLNDNYEGGATHFPKLDINVTPATGRCLVFGNCIKGTSERTPVSLHAGRPVTSGVKWAFNLWFRERTINR